jgi:hypothetical protein
MMSGCRNGEDDLLPVDLNADLTRRSSAKASATIMAPPLQSDQRVGSSKSD